MKRTLLLGLAVAAAVLFAAPFVGGTVGETAFVLAAAAFPALLIGLGALREGRLGGLRWWLPLLAALLGGSLLLMLAFAGRIEDGPRLLGLPLVAAVLLLGLFGLPALLVALVYGLGFDRHGVRSEDLERLRALRSSADDTDDTDGTGEG